MNPEPPQRSRTDLLRYAALAAVVVGVGLFIFLGSGPALQEGDCIAAGPPAGSFSTEEVSVKAISCDLSGAQSKVVSVDEDGEDATCGSGEFELQSDDVSYCLTANEESASGGAGFPPLEGEQNGYPTASVSDEGEADELCQAAGEEWPEEWADAEEGVTLDIPDSDADTICVRG